MRLALACLLARGHLLIEDLPGVGKTTLAQALARVLGLSYQRVQFTSDLLPADIIGVSVYDRDSGRFEFQQGPGVRPAAARRRGQPRDAEGAERAARGDGGAPGHRRRPHPPAAGAVLRRRDAEPELPARHLPAAGVAARPLPDAHRARLPGGGARTRAAARPRPARAARPASRRCSTRRSCWRCRRTCPRCTSPSRCSTTSRRWCATPRESGDFEAGLSPRAAIALLRASQAWALLHGRPGVVPEDVQAVARAVVGHRLELRTAVDGSHAPDLDRLLLGAVAVP